MSIETRAARRTDLREMSAVLARAFDDDPVMTWMWPDEAKRASGLPRLFGALARFHHLAGGGVEVGVDGSGEAIGAAALWDPPGRWRHSRLSELRMLPALVRAFGSRIEIGGEVAETMKRVHPEEPHWYLAIIGSEPAVRGTGYGQALMNSRLQRCDAEHSPAYLESSKPENVPYYQRFGFEVTGEIELPRGGPTIWPMWRSAR